jgi:hypothetical protein
MDLGVVLGSLKLSFAKQLRRQNDVFIKIYWEQTYKKAAPGSFEVRQ